MRGLEEFPCERKQPCEVEKHPKIILGSDPSKSGPTVKKALVGKEQLFLTGVLFFFLFAGFSWP